MLVLFAQITTADWTGDTSAYINGGKALTDAELSEWLQVLRRVVAAWRLRKAGLIRWMTFPGQPGRVFWVGPVNKTLTVRTTAPARPQSTEEAAQRSRRIRGCIEVF